MTPWLNVDELLERQASYDPARFKNECLGLPTALGDHIITRANRGLLSAAPAGQQRSPTFPTKAKVLMAGIDWGGGGRSATVLVIGYIRSDMKFLVMRMERFRSLEDPELALAEIAKRCRQFQVRCIAADGGGNGYVLNRLLLDRLQYQLPLYAILYSMADHAPQQDGSLWKWTVNRSAAIGGVFSRVEKGLLLFPRCRIADRFWTTFAANWPSTMTTHGRSVSSTRKRNPTTRCTPPPMCSWLPCAGLHGAQQWDG